MKSFLWVFGVFFFWNLSAQQDSILVDDICVFDTLFVADTIFVTDTLITVDTLLVKRTEQEDQQDTLFLSSDDVSWSLIPQEETKQEDVVVRQDSGLWLISAKIGFSDHSDHSDWTGYSIATVPPMALQVEYFHNDFISYGGQVLYGRNKYTNDTLTTNFFKNSTVGLAALGTFHYGSWLQDVTHNWFKFGYLDLYASLVVRLDIHRDVTEDIWNESLQQFESGTSNSDVYAKVRLRPIFGARYYISDRFSINVEIGKGNLGILTSSVSWLLAKPGEKTVKRRKK